MRHKVKNSETGERLDVFASLKMPALSRAFIQRLIEGRLIVVNDSPEKPGYRLRFKDTVNIKFRLSELDRIDDIQLPIIYENDDVLVVNKREGVISHARGKYWNEPSVASFVRQVTGQKGERAGIVHRLDRATSGVMICAKTQEALSFLQKQFSSRKVKKTYYAVVQGKPDQPKAVIDMPIGRNPRKPQTFKVMPDGKPARTTYEVLKSNADYSLLKLTPETGRTHQLRVHLQKVGHPIVGDVLYGGAEGDRLYLHAESLEITLPGSQREIFTAPVPKAFKQLVD